MGRELEREDLASFLEDAPRTSHVLIDAQHISSAVLWQVLRQKAAEDSLMLGAAYWPRTPNGVVRLPRLTAEDCGLRFEELGRTMKDDGQRGAILVISADQSVRQQTAAGHFRLEKRLKVEAPAGFQIFCYYDEAPANLLGAKEAREVRPIHAFRLEEQ